MGALDDIREERERQDAKWGQQNHADGTGPETFPLQCGGRNGIEEYEAYSLEVAFKQQCDDRFSRTRADRPGTWTDILLEEVFEVLATRDPADLRTELIQLAAVAAAWVEAIDRRTA